VSSDSRIDLFARISFNCDENCCNSGSFFKIRIEFCEVPASDG
jgi:hypothetical protein